jgi:hypothetical protein
MTESNARRVTRELSSEEEERLCLHRSQIAAELPDLIELDHMRQEARSEPTLSGEFRRAIHESPLTFSVIAQRADIPPRLLERGRSIQEKWMAQSLPPIRIDAKSFTRVICSATRLRRFACRFRMQNGLS